MATYEIGGASIQIAPSISCISSNWLYYGNDGKVYQVAADNSLLPTAAGNELSIDELRAMGVVEPLPFYLRELGEK